MSQEQRRKTKEYVLLLTGVLICFAGFFVSGWVSSVGIIMALLSLQPLVARDVPVPPSVEEARGRKRQVQPRCKKLAIKELIFRANLHPLFLVFFFLLFGGFGSFLLYRAAQSHDPIFIAVSATVSFVLFALLFLTYQSVQSRFAVDRMGIRWEVPAKKTVRMEWGDLVNLTSRKLKSGTVYEVYSLDSSLSFSTGLPNSRQLAACISAAVDGANGDEEIAVTLPSPDKQQSAGVMLLVLGAVMLMAGGFLTSFSKSSWQKINIPVVPLQEVAQAFQGSALKVEGILSASPPLRSRDEKETYGLEQVTFSIYRSRHTTTDSYCAPDSVWLTAGSNKIRLKTKEIDQQFVPVRGKFDLDTQWTNSKIANYVCHLFDSEVENHRGLNCDLSVWTIADGAKVTVIGQVWEENGERLLEADGEKLWISTLTTEEMKKSLFVYFLFSGALLLLGAVYCIAGVVDLVKASSRKNQIRS